MNAGSSPAGVGFAYNDYDNWNTNSNVSSHRAKKYSLQTLPTWQKITFLIGRWYSKGKTTFLSKA